MKLDLRDVALIIVLGLCVWILLYVSTTITP